jgi:hypothetical protein
LTNSSAKLICSSLAKKIYPEFEAGSDDARQHEEQKSHETERGQNIDKVFKVFHVKKGRSVAAYT